jgi:Subtilase family
MLRLPLIKALLTLGALAMAAGAAATPLPASDYAVRPACRWAGGPRRASCLALRLEPGTSAARSQIQALAARARPQAALAKAWQCAALYASSCLTPQNLQSAYFSGVAPDAPSSEPQTIALVDAYNDLSAEADLNTYAGEFGLPACTTANGCFKQVGQDGSESDRPFPKSKAELSAFANGTKRQREKAEEAEGWALESATDVEIAHAICQNCHILLVEASGPEYGELETSENTAASLHATEISNSWGGPEGEGDSSAFDHPGIAITAAAGDDGYLNWDQYATRNEAGSPYFDGADYPASSPHAISVGGTQLSLKADGSWASELPWSSAEGGGGSGCSGSLPAPAWQRAVADWAQVGCGTRRASADVSADADPSTGVNVYDSTPYPEAGGVAAPEWVPIGGTSVASPIVASMFALAGGAHGVAHPAETLYSHLGSPSLHDVTVGGNGECAGNHSACSGSLSSPLDCGVGAWICNATVGYDGPTGVGTPNGIGAFEPGEAAAKGSEEGAPQTGPSEEANPAQGSAGAGGGSTGGKGSGVEPLGGTSSNTAGGAVASGPATKPRAGAQVAARISALALTARARAALHGGRLAVAQLAFSLRLSRAVTVRVTLALRVGASPHAHWRKLPDSLAFLAVKGLNRRRLHAGATLAPGLYRLTFTPAGGRSRSLAFRLSRAAA